MVHGTPNEEWTEKIKDVGLRGSAKIQKGDPFKGVLMSGSTFQHSLLVLESLSSDLFRKLLFPFY